MKQLLTKWWAGLRPKTRRVAIYVFGICTCLIAITLIVCLTITGGLNNLIDSIINALL